MRVVEHDRAAVDLAAANRVFGFDLLAFTHGNDLGRWLFVHGTQPLDLGSRVSTLGKQEEHRRLPLGFLVGVFDSDFDRIGKEVRLLVHKGVHQLLAAKSVTVHVEAGDERAQPEDIQFVVVFLV
jgi:hypothetical protein